MRYLRLTSIAMLVIGVMAIITGVTTDLGAFSVLLGMLMVISGIVKIVALRIMDGQPPALPRTRHDER